MKRRYLISAVIGAGLLCMTTSVVFSSPDEELRDGGVLRELGQLREKIEALEARIAELEKSSPRTAARPLQLTPVVPAPALPSRPNTWDEKEINGVRYYIMPLSTNK